MPTNKQILPLELDRSNDLHRLVKAFEADLLEREHAPGTSRHSAAALYRRVEVEGVLWMAKVRAANPMAGEPLQDLLELAVQLCWLAPYEGQNLETGANVALDVEDDAMSAGLLPHFAAAFQEYAQEFDEGFTLEGLQMFLSVSYLLHESGKSNAFIEASGDFARTVLRDGLRKQLGKAGAERFAKKHHKLAHLLDD